VAVTVRLNEVLRWVYWWHGTETLPEEVSAAQLHYKLNTDFDAGLMGAKKLQALESGSVFCLRLVSRQTAVHTRITAAGDGRSLSQNQSAEPRGCW
jgi:hypothetical protein